MPSCLYFENDQISAADVESLLSTLQQEPGISIYLFWVKRSALHPGISAAIAAKRLRPLAIEEFWYKKPRREGAPVRFDDFVHIPRDAAAGWEKELQEAEPMLYRAELILATGREGKRKIRLPDDTRSTALAPESPSVQASTDAGSGTSNAQDKQKPRRGPTRGTVGYFKIDQKHFPELQRLTSEGMSVHAAASEVVKGGKVAGSNTEIESKVKRLAKHFRIWRAELGETF